MQTNDQTHAHTDKLTAECIQRTQ